VSWLLLAIVIAIGVFATYWFYRVLWMRIVAIVLTAALALTVLFGWALPSVPWPSFSAPASQPVNLTEEMKVTIQQQIDAANAKLASQVSSLETSVKAVTDKDIEQDKRLAELEGRVSTLESDMKAVKSDITALKARLKSVENGDITVTGSPTDLTTDQAAQALADELVAQGWQSDQINVGTIDWSKNPYDNGRETFVTRTIRTQQDLARVLAHPKNGAERAVRAHILKSLKGMPESERQRAMSGKGFVPVQFLDESCFNGNTFYNAGTGTAEREAGDVCKKAGDVWWIYVDSNGKVQWDTAVRADCGNPGLTRPPRPKHPKPTPSPTPTPSSSTSTPTPTPTPTGTPTPTVTPTPTPTSPSPTPTSTCPSGNYCSPKPTATQPTGVASPTGNPVEPTPTAKPTPKPTPLKPEPTAAPTHTQSSAPSDDHSATAQPTSGGTPTASAGQD